MPGHDAESCVSAWSGSMQGRRAQSLYCAIPATAIEAAQLSDCALLRRSTTELVAHHQSALHHELHLAHQAEVCQRIAWHRDDVGELALLDRADVLFPVVVQHARRWQIGGLQGLRRAQAPLGVIFELASLLAVRDRNRGGAAAEYDRDAGGHRTPHRLLQELEAGIAATGFPEVFPLERHQIVDRRHEWQLLRQ